MGLVKKYIQTLKLEKALSYRFDNTQCGQFFINPTEQTIEKLGKLNELTISETANLLAEKSYEFYGSSGQDIAI